MPPSPSVPSQSLLVLDGQAASMKSVDGGAIKGEVVIVNSGSEKFAQKQIAGVRFEPFTFEVGLGMGKSLVQWIAGSLDLSRTRRSGSVVTTNFDHKAQEYRHFRDALITEVTVPKLDGSSKDAGYFTIKFDPEEITYAKGDGAAIQDGVSTKQKAWLCSNFRLRVGKLPCARVASIDAFTIKQGTGIEFPNLKSVLGGRCRRVAGLVQRVRRPGPERPGQGARRGDRVPRSGDEGGSRIDRALPDRHLLARARETGGGLRGGRALLRRALRGADDPQHQGRLSARGFHLRSVRLQADRPAKLASAIFVSV